MLRKLITLCLFLITVPLAALGQHGYSANHLKSMLNGMRDRAQNQWPDTRKRLEKSLPEAVQGLAGHLNDYSPSAGAEPPRCEIPVDLWKNQNSAYNDNSISI